MSLITPKFRVSYPQVFQPRLNPLSNKHEYSVQAIFPPGTDFTKMQQALNQAGEAKWGPDKNKWPKSYRKPFRQAEDRAETLEDGRVVFPPGFEAGAVYLNLKSTQKPAVVDASVNPILDSSEFYPGCWAVASVSAYAYDQAGNRGLNFGLNNIQKIADGDPLGGRMRAEDEFVAVASNRDASSLFS